MTKKMSVNRVLLCMVFTCLSVAQAETESKIRALFVYGGHPFDEKGMYAMLDSFGDVVYDKAEMPKALDLFRPGLEEKYDCIVMYDSYKFPFTQEQTDTFKALLEKGIGLVVLHHSLWGFNGWEAFADITGGQFFFKDGNSIRDTEYKASTWAHDQEVRVTVADKNHPITQGTDDFTLCDETYAKAYIHPDIHVLWTTDHPKSERVIAWTWKYANSPVFATAQGHDNHAYSHPMFRRTIHQAIRWVTQKDNKGNRHDK